MFLLPTSWLRELPVFLILTYLFLHPTLAYPTSMAVALGGVLLLVLFQKLPKDSLARLGWAWSIFLAYALLSALWGYVPGLTLQAAGLLFAGSLLYLLAAQQDEASKGRMEFWVLILGVGAALWALGQWGWGFDELKFQLNGLSKPDYLAVEKAIYYRRPMGPFATVGSLEALLLLLVPIAGTKAFSQTGSKARIFWAVTLLFLIVLALTKSIGAWVSLGSALLIVLAARREWKWLFGVLGAGALVLGAILFARGVGHWAVSSFGMRTLLWGSAWKLFLAHPLFGTGLGSFDEAYQRAGFSLVEGGARYPHNLFLQLLSETGLVGTGLFLVALGGWVRRFKVPSRWEGWGIGTGVLAFFIFSFLDLPFQMPELVWAFALLLGRLELRPEKPVRSPEVPGSCVKIALLVVLGITGFWPPFRPLNLAILATGLWVAATFFQAKFEKVPFLFFLGGLFLATRAFDSPSALGTVRCLEMAGLVLAFILFLKGINDPKGFLKWFMGLGLFFGLAVWIYSFRSSDIRDWTLFPNAKQVGTFLVVGFLFFLGQAGTFRAFFGKWTGWVGTFFTIATLVCLKSFGAMAAWVIGLFSFLSTKAKWAGALVALSLLGAILYFRTMVFRGLDMSPTQWDRFGIWEAALRVWTRAPLFGAGPGAFAGLFHQVKSPRDNGVSRYLMDAQFAHNEALEYLTAFGLVGAFFFLVFLLHSWDRKPKEQGPALWALSAASFVDFCLHTPLILLQGVGLLTSNGRKKEEGSWTSALLVGGVALGLFGSAALAPRSLAQAGFFEAQDQLPQALRSFENAEKLNAWDNRYAAAKGEFMEKLFRATQDPTWAAKADEAFQRTMELERTDGQWVLRNAERLTARLDKNPSAVNIQKAQEAWTLTRRVFPFNAFAHFEEGLFEMKNGDKTRALLAFETAAQMEPNFAAAWVRSGWLLKEKGERTDALYCFKKAWEVHERWKDASRIDPLETQLVSLPPEVVLSLTKELKP